MDDPDGSAAAVGDPFTVYSHNGGARERHAAPTDTANALDSTGGYAPGQGGTVIAFPSNGGNRLADEVHHDESPPLRLSSNNGPAAPAVLGDGVTPGDVPEDPKPDGPRFAAMGDAVTVPVITWIGRRLIEKMEVSGADA